MSDDPTPERPASRGRRRLGLAVLVLLAIVVGVLVVRSLDPGPDEPVPTAECVPTAGTPIPDGDATDLPPEPDPEPGILDRLSSLLDSQEPHDVSGEVVWEADLEDGELFPPYADGVEEGEGSEAEVRAAEAPEVDGTAVKMTMPPSRGVQADVPNRKFLNVPDFTWSAGDEYWYGIRLYFADDWQLGEISDDREQFVSLVSFRYADGSRSGTGSIKVVETRSGAPCLVHTRSALSAEEYGDDAGEDPIYLGPVVEEQWIDLVCHFRWSTIAEDALKECWRDGALKGRSTRANMTVDAPVTHRVGIYEGPGVDHQRTLYWDNHRIGRSYEAVDPSREPAQD